MLTDGNACEQDNDDDDDETDSTASEVLVSFSDLLHYAAVENERRQLCSLKEPRSCSFDDQEEGHFVGKRGQDFSQPQTLETDSPEEPVSNDRVGSLEMGQPSDHNYSQPIADLYHDHGTRSCDQMSGSNSLELINCYHSDSKVWLPGESSREGYYYYYY